MDKVKKNNNKGLKHTSSQGKKHPVIEAKPQFGHPREHGFQLDAAHDVAAHHTAVGIHLQPLNTHLVLKVTNPKKECQINSMPFLWLHFLTVQLKTASTIPRV